MNRRNFLFRTLAGIFAAPVVAKALPAAIDVPLYDPGAMQRRWRPKGRFVWGQDANGLPIKCTIARR